jgi:hypothetical protein
MLTTTRVLKYITSICTPQNPGVPRIKKGTCSLTFSGKAGTLTLSRAPWLSSDIRAIPYIWFSSRGRRRGDADRLKRESKM